MSSTFSLEASRDLEPGDPVNSESVLANSEPTRSHCHLPNTNDTTRII
jgi:hypothetical protein